MSPFITVNGQPVPFREGQTVLEAARAASIHIPSLCFHRKTGAASTCRVCVVEIDGRSGLHPSCALTAEAGMSIRTESPAVRAARRIVIDLLLSAGRHDCTRCGAGGSCELQDAAEAMGIQEASLAVPRSYPSRDDSSPMILRDPDKCILCGRCVRACRETVCHDVLGIGGRSAATKVICDDDLPMGESGCVHCGECVQICPTGAFLDRASSAPAARNDLETIETVCPYCGVGCGLTLHVDTNAQRIVRVTGVEGHPASDGMLCVKGRYGLDFIQSQERLRAPLLRSAEGFTEVSWEKALSVVAGRFRDAVETFGPDSVAGLSSAKCTNEENYLFQKLFRQVLKTNNVDHCARLCHSSTVTGLGGTLGAAAMTGDIGGIAGADVILVIGSDTTTAHPVIASRIRQAVRTGGSRLIVIDPRRTGIARAAQIYARHRCGTDVAVINGLMHLILANGWEDRDFIERRCEGFPELRDLVSSYTPARVEKISGVPASLLKEMAALFGRAETASVYYAMGITQHVTGTDNVRSLASLQLLCGNLGIPGGGINPLRGQCNVQGACDMGALPGSLPGYAPVTSEESRLAFAAEWDSSPPSRPGLTSLEMIDAARWGDVKALYIMGENPCLSDPDSSRVAESLSKTDFLVVQDIFLTQTAKLADVVLPAACFAEKDGLFTSTERRVQRLRRALAPPGEAREDWCILRDLAGELGRTWPYLSAEDVQEEIRRVVPAYAGITWERAAAGGVQWPCPAIDHPGTDILHRDSFPIGRARMRGAAYSPSAEETDAEFPFVLTTGRLLPQFHTGTMTRRSPGIEALAGVAVEISPEDANALGIADGDRVEVRTRRGSLQAPAFVTARISRGTLFIPFHFQEAAANLLTSPARDPEAGIPELKVCAARMRKVS
jgi:formate dehydrogenase alpha subunit